MSTVKKVLNSTDWVRIADGTETKSLQVSKGNVLMAITDTAVAPGANADSHNLYQGMFFTITPPSIVWVKGIGSSEVVVS